MAILRNVNMKKIKELIVVEGKHDLQRLQNLFDCNVILTNGLSLPEDVLETIKTASENQGVIVMTDPDNPGRIIRDKIVAYAPKVKHIFVEKKDAIGKRNVGIEYVLDEKLLELLDSSVTFTQNKTSITKEEYLQLDLMGDSKKRDFLTSKLKIGKCNNKRLYQYLNMLDVTYQQAKTILEEYGK